MAQESVNLDKDEAEILKPSSPTSSPSPSPAPPPSGASSSQSIPPSLFLKPPQDFLLPRQENSEPPAADVAAAPSCPAVQEKESQPPVQFGNRCSSCRRKVGLTGFRCRCGDLFCSRHRYSNTHDCSYDYKAAGREEISKANPVIRAAKIIKI